MTTGTDLINAERVRQMVNEGWDASRDDGYVKSELILAALAYAFEAVPYNEPVECAGGLGSRQTDEGENPPAWWPWDTSWWRPSPDPVRNLEKAGALIAAEIDRLQRARKAAA